MLKLLPLLVLQLLLLLFNKLLLLLLLLLLPLLQRAVTNATVTCAGTAIRMCPGKEFRQALPL
jgi:hypothetical protein